MSTKNGIINSTFQRNLYLIIATSAMIVCGLMYNLTVFFEVLSEDLNASYSTISIVFSISQICFCIGGLVLGFVFNKFKYKWTMTLASVSMGLGLILASQSTQVWQLFLFYSLIMNISAGFIYKSVLSTVIPWFKDKPGLATGIMMMGAGLTAFIFNYPTTILILTIGWRNTMFLLGCLALCITLSAAHLIQRNTDQKTQTVNINEKTENRNDCNSKEMLATSKFYLFFVWTILLLAGCTTITGNSVGLSREIGLNVSESALLSMVISLFNAISRVWYGTLYDKRGRKLSMGIATTFFLLGALFLEIAMVYKNMYILIVSFMFIGIAFGGVPTISSTYTLKTFGKKFYASNFGIMGTYSVFSPILGTTIFSIIYRNSNSYLISSMYIFIYAIISVIFYILLNNIKEKPQILSL